MAKPKERTLPLAPTQEVSGAVYDAPTLILMDPETGEEKPFRPDKENPGRVYSMVGYASAGSRIFDTRSGEKSRILTKPLGRHPLRDHYQLVQGWGNLGFQTIYLFRTDEVIN
jgi:hypothetical protein